MVGYTNNFAEITKNLEGQIADYSMKTVAIAALVTVLLVIAGMLFKERQPKLKTPIFLLLAGVIGSTTLFLFGSTVYLNVVSDSGGPVHWHADVEYWACGSEIELRDPYRFLSNKIGTATLHEHDDKRIHLEGVVVDEDEDATLGNFMHVIDGNLEKGTITIPVHQDYVAEDDIDGDEVDASNLLYLESLIRGSGNSRYLTLNNGDMCGEGPDAEPGELQVFVYNYNKDDDTYTQTKLEDPESYVYAPYPNVPPADCIIFEFDTPKDFTNKLCQQYGLKDSKRCTEFGVKEFDPKLCNIRDVTDYSQLENRNNAELQLVPENIEVDNSQLAPEVEETENSEQQESAGVL